MTTLNQQKEEAYRKEVGSILIFIFISYLFLFHFYFYFIFISILFLFYFYFIFISIFLFYFYFYFIFISIFYFYFYISILFLFLFHFYFHFIFISISFLFLFYFYFISVPQIVELHEERQLLQRKHVEALDIAEKRYQSSLSDLQQSVQNTRERTRVLLADKDSEMLEMKSRLLRKSSSYLDDWEPELPSPEFAINCVFIFINFFLVVLKVHRKS